MNRFSLLPLLLPLAACPVEPGIPETRCDEEITALDAAAESPLGFSADDLFDTTGLDFSETLRYSGTAVETPLTLSIAPGAVRYIDGESFTHFPDGTIEPANQPCEDVLAIDATMAFATGDGAFAESLPVTLTALSALEAHILLVLDTSTLSGTFDPMEHVPAGEYDVLESRLSIDLRAGGSQGALSIHGEAASDECDGCVDYVTEDVARWGDAG